MSASGLREARVASKHDRRRQKLAEVVMDVIARDGFDAVTVRRIASEVGYSTAVVSHYFCDKQDMLLCAYATFDEYASRLFDEISACDPTDLLGYLVGMSAAGQGGLGPWRAFLAVWDKFLRDPAFAREIRGWTREAVTCIDALIRARNPDRLNTKKLAERFLALVQGISMQMLFDPENWTDGDVRRALEAEIELILGPPTASDLRRSAPPPASLRP
jgi:AcrR family transcriptional regulator